MTGNCNSNKQKVTMTKPQVPITKYTGKERTWEKYEINGQIL